MKKEPNIEELLIAASRVSKDKQRQQKLADLVDQWAAQETAKTDRRKPLYWLSAAAILLLMAATVLAISRISSPAKGILMAAAPHLQISEKALDERAEANETYPDIVHAPSPKVSEELLADVMEFERTPEETSQEPDNEDNGDNLSNNNGQNRSSDNDISDNDPHPEEPILTTDRTNQQLAEATVERRVFTRTSKRLVNSRETTKTIANTKASSSEGLIACTGTQVVYEIIKL